MQIVKIQGGLGNQMFQYAFGFSLKKKTKKKVYFDISHYDNQKDSDNFTPRVYLLNIAFDLNLPLFSKKNIYWKIINKINTFKNKQTKNIIDSEKGYSKIDFNTSDNNLYYNGYWQDERYFIEFRNDILKIFKPKIFSNECLFWIDKITNQKEETISVHFRRGDYSNKKAINNIHGTCSDEYYFKSFQILDDFLNKYVIFVFSDEIEWVKLNIKFNVETFFIDNIKNPWEEIYLQSICKHNIIANSSFSWWGAWLNTNPQKINIGPKAWFSDAERNENFKNILPNYFIKL